MNELQDEIRDRLRQHLHDHHGIKWYIAITATYSKLNNEQERISTEQVFRSTTLTAVNEQDIDLQMAQALQEIYAHSQEFEAEGSGWSLDEVVSLVVNTVAYVPLLGNSYIKLPRFIESKKAVLNIKNQDNKCILWSILAHFHPLHWRENPNQVKKYRPYEHG